MISARVPWWVVMHWRHRMQAGMGIGRISRACQTCWLCNLGWMWRLGPVEPLGSHGMDRAPERSLETGGPP